MKKEKKLKLDTLSSSELANKEANQVRGGAVVICTCSCICNGAEDRIFTRLDDKNFVYKATQEEP